MDKPSKIQIIQDLLDKDAVSEPVKEHLRAHLAYLRDGVPVLTSLGLREAGAPAVQLAQEREVDLDAEPSSDAVVENQEMPETNQPQDDPDPFADLLAMTNGGS